MIVPNLMLIYSRKSKGKELGKINKVRLKVRIRLILRNKMKNSLVCNLIGKG